MTEALPDDVYLSSAQIRARYGNVSEMWIYRRQADQEFPQPATDFGTKRRFWLLRDLLAWESARLNKGRPAA